MRSGRRVRLFDIVKPRDRARRRLEDLYRVGRCLALSASDERATQAVLAVIAETMPMRSAILIDDAKPRPRMTAWLAGPVDPVLFAHVRESARSAYADLVGDVALERDADATHILPSFAQTPPQGPASSSFLVLPLAVGSRAAFGVLQLEVTVPIDETDLAFVHACGCQLAMAIARHRATPTPTPRSYGAGGVAEAVRYRDDLLSLVSHDLKGPLGAILMTTDALIAGECVVHSRELALIRRSGKRMLNLITDLLDVASIDARHLAVELHDEPVPALISEAVEMLRPMATAKRIALELDAADDLPDVHVDRNRTHQIVANLVGNALKFTEPDGVIGVRAWRDGEQVCVSVTDTGHGISEGNLDRVFDRFWQAPENVHQGTGLGLYIVKSLVEAQGGAISVRSVFGVGSTFTFTLLVAAPQ